MENNCDKSTEETAENDFENWEEPLEVCSDYNEKQCTSLDNNNHRDFEKQNNQILSDSFVECQVLPGNNFLKLKNESLVCIRKTIEDMSQSGASLNTNKAGMNGFDVDRVTKIIHEATKGSKFAENEARKKSLLNERILIQAENLRSLSVSQLEHSQAVANGLLSRLELTRRLDKYIIHVDMDAFYAAVEMRDNPSLTYVPMAVGSNSMLSTSNYIARKFGVQAGMPGFIGRKLCPQLVVVNSNFEKYEAESKKIRSVMYDYDPDFCPMSLDEAYMDFTAHAEEREFVDWSKLTYIGRHVERVEDSSCTCDPNNDFRDQILGEKMSTLTTYLQSADESNIYEDQILYEMNIDGSSVTCQGQCEVCLKTKPQYKICVFGRGVNGAVSECRFRIQQKTNLTASAGIACNTMLAKICSDYNKPNGQFQLPSNKDSIVEFISSLPIGKVSGIGKVTESLLGAIGVKVCFDLFEKRSILYYMYSEGSFEHFMSITLGLGSTSVERDSERKSISCEETFGDLSSEEDLIAKCYELCQSLWKDMASEHLVGRTIGLKIKTDTFQVRTRSVTTREYTQDVDVIFHHAKNLLMKEFDWSGGLTLRLMGVRMSNLLNESSVSSKSCTLKDLLKKSFIKTQAPGYEQSDVHMRSEDQSDLVRLNTLCSSNDPDHCPESGDLNRISRNNSNSLDLRHHEGESSGAVCGTVNKRHQQDSVDLHTDNKDCSSYFTDTTVGNSTTLSDGDQLFAKSDQSLTSIDCPYMCPVCFMEQSSTSLSAFNRHVDICLNRKTVQAILSEQNSNVTSSKLSETGSKNSSSTKLKVNTKEDKNSPSRKRKITPTSRSIYSYFK